MTKPDFGHLWASGHRKKVRYDTRWQAWRGAVRLCWRKRRLDVLLRPYRCRLGLDYARGHVYPEHWHIGHSRKRKTQRTVLRTWVVWPYYRLRRRWRRLVRSF